MKRKSSLLEYLESTGFPEDLSKRIEEVYGSRELIKGSKVNI